MQIRHNSAFVNLNSNFKVVEKTDYSLIIAEDEFPEVLINFPAQGSDYIYDLNNTVPLELSTIHSTLSNAYIKLRYFKLRGITEKYDVMGIYYLGDNVPKPQLDLFIEFGEKVMDVLHRKLSTKRVLDRLDYIDTIIPAISAPTFKDKVRVLFNRLFKGSTEVLQEARPTKVFCFPYMSNINIESIVKHAVDEVERYYSVSESQALHSINAFIVFKVACAKNAFEDEVQLVLNI